MCYFYLFFFFSFFAVISFLCSGFNKMNLLVLLNINTVTESVI